MVVDDDGGDCGRIMLSLVRAPSGDELRREQSVYGILPAVSITVAEHATPQHLVFIDVQVDANIPVRAQRGLQQEHSIDEQHRVVRRFAGRAVRGSTVAIAVRPERDQQSGDQCSQVEVTVGPRPEETPDTV